MAKTKLNITVTDEVLSFLTWVKEEFHIRPSDIINRVIEKHGEEFIENMVNEALSREDETPTREEVAADLEAFDNE